MSPHSPQEARSAIEALRAGVPDDAAIALLGSSEAALIQDFAARLRLCQAALRDDKQVEGIGIVGAFGAGKSHQLGFLAKLAQRENFIVSLLPVSKETPLFDTGRLFGAAIRAAVVPGINDDVMTAVLGRLRPKEERYDALQQWAEQEVRSGRLSGFFPALLHLIPGQAVDPSDYARIGRFFAGSRLKIGDVKTWLKRAGAAEFFDVKPVREADLVEQRLRFAPRLFLAAGYSGWCILLDEVELIGRYSPLQRGRSYAELGRWLGLGTDGGIPGVVTIAAISDDYNDEFFDRRRDDELVPPRLEERGALSQAAMARKGIEWLRRVQPTLRAPDEKTLRETLEKVSRIYEEAYGWSPPTMDPGERLAGRTMRQYIKSWITTWDLLRLYKEAATIEIQPIAIDYSESSDLEKLPAAAEGDDADE